MFQIANETKKTATHITMRLNINIL